jgi:predicted metal-dependent HD superfamily phosphohydrolase
MNLEEIKVRYSEPHRFYHTWNHIEYMFRIARENGLSDEIDQKGLLWYAIVYLIYLT